jgi:hypothetical protein
MNNKNSLATAGLILGITGIVSITIPLFIGLFLGGPQTVLAIIFGAVGLSRSKQLDGVGRSAAITGLVLGIIGAALPLLGAGTLW